VIAHQQLLDLIEAALLVGPAVAGGNVKRHRTRPMADDQAQMVSLRVVNSRGAGQMDLVEWVTTVGVLCVCSAIEPTTPDAAVASLLETVHARIAGATTLQPAGYLLDKAFRLEWDQEELDERIGAVEAIYTVRHFGALTNITV
jgi:hypothetical protein